MATNQSKEVSFCALDIYLAATGNKRDLGALALLREQTVRSSDTSLVLRCGQCAAQFIIVNGAFSDAANAVALCDGNLSEAQNFPADLKRPNTWPGDWPSVRL